MTILFIRWHRALLSWRQILGNWESERKMKIWRTDFHLICFSVPNIFLTLELFERWTPTRNYFSHEIFSGICNSQFENCVFFQSNKLFPFYNDCMVIHRSWSWKTRKKFSIYFFIFFDFVKSQLIMKSFKIKLILIENEKYLFFEMASNRVIKKTRRKSKESKIIIFR